jgi:hypothetical protein
MVIRLEHKKQKNFTVAFKTEISVLYMSISIQYMYIKLNSVRNKNAISFNLNPKHNCILILFLVCQSDYHIWLKHVVDVS